MRPYAFQKTPGSGRGMSNPKVSNFRAQCRGAGGYVASSIVAVNTWPFSNSFLLTSPPLGGSLVTARRPLILKQDADDRPVLGLVCNLLDPDWPEYGKDVPVIPSLRRISFFFPFLPYWRGSPGSSVAHHTRGRDVSTLRNMFLSSQVVSHNTRF